MSKFLFLTDSAANPRGFTNPSEVTHLEETYPYLIRNQYKDSTFWQLSLGSVTSEQLCSQAISYLNHWKPDIIIVQTGLADCRPEAFTEFQKTVITKFSGPIFDHIKKYVYHPKLIKRRQVYRVTKRSFRKTLTKFKLIFSDSKIYWLDIIAGAKYEEMRPGVNKRIEDYNPIIRKIYGNDFVPVAQKIIEVNGFNEDDLHWNKLGHKVVADILHERIISDFNI